jgi:hypothetical protein
MSIDAIDRLQRIEARIQSEGRQRERNHGRR